MHTALDALHTRFGRELNDDSLALSSHSRFALADDASSRRRVRQTKTSCDNYTGNVNGRAFVVFAHGTLLLLHSMKSPHECDESSPFIPAV